MPLGILYYLDSQLHFYAVSRDLRARSSFLFISVGLGEIAAECHSNSGNTFVTVLRKTSQKLACLACENNFQVTPLTGRA